MSRFAIFDESLLMSELKSEIVRKDSVDYVPVDKIEEVLNKQVKLGEFKQCKKDGYPEESGYYITLWKGRPVEESLTLTYYYKLLKNWEEEKDLIAWLPKPYLPK